jgi:hypothetical protein
MARRKAKARGRPARVPISDEELIARLQDNAPDALAARMSEADFDKVVERLLNEPPLSDDVPHFYCRKCAEYHLKTHPHYSTNKTEY